jgi:hypothetical protein
MGLRRVFKEGSRPLKVRITRTTLRGTQLFQLQLQVQHLLSANCLKPAINTLLFFQFHK